MKALSVLQPWTWLLATGYKPVENRGRQTTFRGEFLLHASRNFDQRALNTMLAGKHPVTGGPLTPSLYKAFATDWERRQVRTGGIVGTATLVDCIDIKDQLWRGVYDSPWFVGPFGYIIEKPLPLPHVPCQGMLGFFEVPEAVMQQVKALAP